ncbi:prohead protease/major capsid protein fusion protein [Aestuariibius insulae]|uniref:prohead protease/major capsid protein fusion protein n=1 Tax=Aestuariibius insulae TaxID=2058287 RepID=UPI00345ED25A
MTNMQPVAGQEQQVSGPLAYRQLDVRPETFDVEARTIDVVWTTGAIVQRTRWEGWDDKVEYDEELVVSENAVRFERLNGGAPFLNTHRAWSVSDVLGIVVEGSARIEGGQGVATIRLTEAEDVADVILRIVEGSVKNVSVGYRVHRYEITKTDGERELWRAVDWEPFEISAVPIGADPEARTRSQTTAGAAAYPCTLIRQDALAARAASMETREMTTETAAAPMPGQDDSTTPTPPTTETRASPESQAAPASGTPEPTSTPAPSPDADTVRAQERQRSAQILTLCQRHGIPSDTSADLIARGVTIDEARTAVLDALAARNAGGRIQEPSPAAPRGDGAEEVAYRDALSNALLHRYDPAANVLSEEAREFRGLSLVELARHALDRRHVSTRGQSKMEVASAAFQMRSTGYHTTSDFASILANVANKTLRASYERTTRTFQAWARRATITDFKPVTRAQLGGAPDLKKVVESGEFKYGTIGEGAEVYALATYGRIVAITRQVIVNDDLDAFTRIPNAFGASAADLESDIVYQILLQNPEMADGTALFASAHGNLGTAARVTEAALAAAYRGFGQQKGLEKRLISVLPSYIIVPPGPRSVEARKQVTATTPSNTADVNTYANRLEPIEEPRLIPASGQDPWFLAADPARVDTIEYAYLDGQEGVYTETEMGFDVDGLKIKARHDFAAKAIDWRGLYKNPGAAPA